MLTMPAPDQDAIARPRRIAADLARLVRAGVGDRRAGRAQGL